MLIINNNNNNVPHVSKQGLIKELNAFQRQLNVITMSFVAEKCIFTSCTKGRLKLIFHKRFKLRFHI